MLHEHGERVVEIDRPKRPARRNGAKSDALDAARAAREALARERLTEPRQRGWREAVRVLLTTRQGAMAARTKAITHLKALLVSAPANLREGLRRSGNERLLTRCAHLRVIADRDIEHQSTVLALRATARRALALQAEADELEAELTALVADVAPELLAQTGVGPISAAQLLIAFSHHGRLHNEAAFAALGGAAPIPRHQTLPQALPRPPALPAATEQPQPQTEHHNQHALTSTEASRSPAARTSRPR
jgi:transposase